MKTLLLLALLALALPSEAVRRVTVESATTSTVPGVGGNAEIGYAFAKGDVITLDAKAAKKMEMVLAYIYPETPVLGRSKFTKQATMSFTMPADGIVIFRFISDRSGRNEISYTVTRTPASDAVQDYNTRIVWEKPTEKPGTRIPRRAE